MNTPLQSIRKYCLWCCNDQASEVRLCQSPQCGLYPYRLGRMPGLPGQSCLKAIRARCLDCCCWNDAEVRRCKTDCVLNPYRMGTNPNYSEETREKHRQAAKNRLSFAGTPVHRAISTRTATGQG